MSVLLLSAGSSGSDEKHQNQIRSNHGRSEAKSKIPAPAITIVVQPAPVQIIQQAPVPEKKQPDQEWYERPTITDWGVLSVTLAYVVISIGLLRATKRQAMLMQANFDQWIDLNWDCAEKVRDNKLSVWVEMINPTGFPITFTGHLALGDDRREFVVNVLAPKSPKSVDFSIPVADGQYGPIERRVTARFTYRHKITNAPVADDWIGTLECIWFGIEHKWHAKFTRFMA